MKGLSQLMRQAQEMQANMQKAQDELAATEVEGVAGGGMVKVVVTCKHEVRRVTHWSFGLCRSQRYRRAIGVQNCINIQYSIHLSGAAASSYLGHTRRTNFAARARVAANGRPSCRGQLIQTDRKIVI